MIEERAKDPDTPPVALTVAGSDSGGGAGIQADLKTFHAHRVFGTTAITAVTAQDTRGVRGVEPVDPGMVAGQIRAVADDLEPAACKSGMLANAAVVEAAADALGEAGLGNYVLDPVMVAASGDPLLEEEAVDAVRRRLLPQCTVVTPNLHETEMLVEREIRDEDAMREALVEGIWDTTTL
ncbi:MAG: bifunctional hydroxymethylpyrimidine kinase/phosphomethylpyrimidine kinase, partial [Gemmatimonadota bacterium]